MLALKLPPQDYLCKRSYDAKGRSKHIHASRTCYGTGQVRFLQTGGKNIPDAQLVLLIPQPWHLDSHDLSPRRRTDCGTELPSITPPLLNGLSETGGTLRRASHVRLYERRALLTTYGQRRLNNSRLLL